MGALTFTELSRHNVGDRVMVVGTVAFAATYANPAGDTYTPETFGLSSISPINIVVVGGQTQNGTKTVLQAPVDELSGTFRLFTTAGTEAGNGTNQSAVTFGVHVWGVP